MEDIKKTYDKVRDIILSCNNASQLRVAVKVFNKLLDKHNKDLTDKQINTLKQLIGLMRIKCVKGKEEDKVNEIFNSGKDFKTQLNLSGQSELQDLAPQMKEEINIGTQIEQNHLPLEQAQELATQNVNKIADYYTNPNFCIIAVESKNGNKKTIRVEKELYEKSKTDDLQLIMDDMEIFHEDLDTNEISNRLRDQLRQQQRQRFTKSEIFNKIREKRKQELKRRRAEDEVNDGELEEATGASSAGAFVAPLNQEPITRRFAKNEIPVTKNGITKPIGKIYSMDILEEDDEIEEAVDYGSAVGSYVTPAMWAKNKKNWRGANKLAYPGGKFVNIKEKCSTFPYCNQGYGSKKTSPITLTNTSDMKIDNVFNENKIIKKSNLKLKK
tara:strand:+ start:1171 stop:2325 length:1155 start_codon:yes stop_codon:yes gene_type:complete